MEDIALEEDASNRMGKIIMNERSNEVPPSILTIFIGYENSWNNIFGSKANSERHINDMLTHAQSFLCLSSLGTQLKLQVQ